MNNSVTVQFGSVLVVCQRETYENSTFRSRQEVIPRFITHYALAEDVSLRESPFTKAHSFTFSVHESGAKRNKVNRLHYVNGEKIKLNKDDSVAMHTDSLYLKPYLVYQEYHIHIFRYANKL